MPDNAVEIADVSKRFGSQTAVDHLDLVVPQGSIYGFIGPNGSGKTTTMRMILRIYQPDEGRVTVLGQDAGQATNDKIGYLPEERGLYRRMTVKRVLKYFAQLKSLPKADEAVADWLERVGATEWGSKRVEQLSKGMAQKVQFISAVIAQPQLIILDEPFSGLDPVNMNVLRDIVLQLRDAGSTIIFSTHDMDVAEKLCDRVFMIYRGQKVLDGTLDEIQAEHGEDRLRVRLEGGIDLPSHIAGVETIISEGRFYSLKPESHASKPVILDQLTRLGTVEHFETVRPSLHDIFVRIAGPEAKQDLHETELAEGATA